MKSFVNTFVDIALTFFHSSFNSFSTSTCFVLNVYLNFLVNHQSLSFLRN